MPDRCPPAVSEHQLDHDGRRESTVHHLHDFHASVLAFGVLVKLGSSKFFAFGNHPMVSELASLACIAEMPACIVVRDFDE